MKNPAEKCGWIIEKETDVGNKLHDPIATR